MLSKYKCQALTIDKLDNIKSSVSSIKTYGWVESKRDHGGLMFIDLRYKLSRLQCIISSESENLSSICKKINIESVVQIYGLIQKRPIDSIKREDNGDIELFVSDIEIISEALTLPFALDQANLSEDLRLKYRFLDLRRRSMQEKIRMRAAVIRTIRESMESMDFIEIHTPLLSAPSPEGARDYVVPSRIHPGQFYALPQAPQQFKQLLMASGFERYYQIAPCFRDEDPRSDRLLGGFYQLDMEMSFATQEDVFQVVETVLSDVFTKFSNLRSKITFPKISYDDAMQKYGSDKPDLRNPLEFIDITELFKADIPQIFQTAINEGGKIFALPCPELSEMPRRFFDNIDKFGKNLGLGGVGYFISGNDYYKGTMSKVISDQVKEHIISSTKDASLQNKADGAFIIAHHNLNVFYKAIARLRDFIGQELNLIDNDDYKFCWIVDFPMYEIDEDGKLDFGHNPFSMPQGGMDAILNKKPTQIKAYQYDIICNGCEICSGAVRNHSPELMYKVFEIIGYSKDDVDQKFGGMIKAFKYGTPPHAGCAPGIERILMLLAKENNVREVIPFPLNQNGRDLMMNSPSALDFDRLDELNLKVELYSEKNIKDK